MSNEPEQIELRLHYRVETQLVDAESTCVVSLAGKKYQLHQKDTLEDEKVFVTADFDVGSQVERDESAVPCLQAEMRSGGEFLILPDRIPLEFSVTVNSQSELKLSKENVIQILNGQHALNNVVEVLVLIDERQNTWTVSAHPVIPVQLQFRALAHSGVEVFVLGNCEELCQQTHQNRMVADGSGVKLQGALRVRLACLGKSYTAYRYSNQQIETSETLHQGEDKSIRTPDGDPLKVRLKLNDELNELHDDMPSQTVPLSCESSESMLQSSGFIVDFDHVGVNVHQIVNWRVSFFVDGLEDQVTDIRLTGLCETELRLSRQEAFPFDSAWHTDCLLVATAEDCRGDWLLKTLDGEYFECEMAVTVKDENTKLKMSLYPRVSKVWLNTRFEAHVTLWQNKDTNSEFSESESSDPPIFFSLEMRQFDCDFLSWRRDSVLKRLHENMQLPHHKVQIQLKGKPIEFDAVKNTYAQLLVPLIKKDGSYDGRTKETSGNPSKWHNIWGEADGTDPVGDPNQTNESAIQCVHRIVSDSTLNVEEARNSVFNRLQKTYINREKKVSELQRSAEQRFKSLFEHIAAIVRGRMEAALVLPSVTDRASHMGEATEWFAFLMRAWCRFRKQNPHGDEHKRFRESITEDKKPPSDVGAAGTLTYTTKDTMALSATFDRVEILNEFTNALTRYHLCSRGSPIRFVDVKSTYAQLLVPLIKKDGSYDGRTKETSGTPSKWHNIWREADGTDPVGNPNQTKESAIQCVHRIVSDSTLNVEEARNSVFTRLRKTYSIRGEKVFELLGVTTKGLNAVTEEQLLAAEQHYKSLLEHAAAIVRGRMEAALVLPMETDRESHMREATEWFVFLMRVWCRFRHQNPSGNEQERFRESISEPTAASDTLSDPASLKPPEKVQQLLQLSFQFDENTAREGSVVEFDGETFSTSKIVKVQDAQRKDAVWTRNGETIKFKAKTKSSDELKEFQLACSEDFNFVEEVISYKIIVTNKVHILRQMPDQVDQRIGDFFVRVCKGEVAVEQFTSITLRFKVEHCEGMSAVWVSNLSIGNLHLKLDDQKREWQSPVHVPLVYIDSKHDWKVRPLVQAVINNKLYNCSLSMQKDKPDGAQLVTDGADLIATVSQLTTEDKKWDICECTHESEDSLMPVEVHLRVRGELENRTVELISQEGSSVTAGKSISVATRVLPDGSVSGLKELKVVVDQQPVAIEQKLISTTVSKVVVLVYLDCSQPIAHMLPVIDVPMVFTAEEESVHVLSNCPELGHEPTSSNKLTKDSSTGGWVKWQGLQLAVINGEFRLLDDQPVTVWRRKNRKKVHHWPLRLLCHNSAAGEIGFCIQFNKDTAEPMVHRSVRTLLQIRAGHQEGMTSLCAKGVGLTDSPFTRESEPCVIHSFVEKDCKDCREFWDGAVELAAAMPVPTEGRDFELRHPDGHTLEFALNAEKSNEAKRMPVYFVLKVESPIQPVAFFCEELVYKNPVTDIEKRELEDHFSDLAEGKGMFQTLKESFFPQNDSNQPNCTTVSLRDVLQMIEEPTSKKAKKTTTTLALNSAENTKKSNDKKNKNAEIYEEFKFRKIVFDLLVPRFKRCGAYAKPTCDNPDFHIWASVEDVQKEQNSNRQKYTDTGQSDLEKFLTAEKKSEIHEECCKFNGAVACRSSAQYFFRRVGHPFGRRQNYPNGVNATLAATHIRKRLRTLYHLQRQRLIYNRTRIDLEGGCNYWKTVPNLYKEAMERAEAIAYVNEKTKGSISQLLIKTAAAIARGRAEALMLPLVATDKKHSDAAITWLECTVNALREYFSENPVSESNLANTIKHILNDGNFPPPNFNQWPCTCKLACCKRPLIANKSKKGRHQKRKS
ncbi:hypothetical protein BOX15_Mlig018956g1 [Macrostomum lignano]|uniref:Uncharacterized protein n=1 Tax=Macrostomum lignano TaxID=282301 RepID=A0A267E429_9PLAT|nr:hypothetical protein BOX15_Mlig018956g1 [Macrostomum lignano]